MLCISSFVDVVPERSECAAFGLAINSAHCAVIPLAVAGQQMRGPTFWALPGGITGVGVCGL